MIALHPGDTLDVEAGDYAGFISGWDGTPASSGDPYGYIDGTAGAPITIQAAPGTAAGSVVINSRNNETPVGIDLEPGDNYITISGLTVNGSSSSGGIAQYPTHGEGIKIAGSTNVTVEDCTVTNIDYGFGIIPDNDSGVELLDNTIDNIHDAGNTLYGHGIYLSGSTSGAVVRGNDIYDNDETGIHIDGDASEGGTGLVSGALIEDNVIDNNGQNAINADGLQDSTIENNLIYDYQDYGICLYQIDASAPSENNVIVNNTIDAGSTGSGAAVRILDGSTGNTILNDILLGGGGVTLRISSDSISGLVSNYNVVGSLYQSDDTGDTESLAQWQSATGQDANSFTATAAQLFVSPSNNSYQELSTSPSIGAGTLTDAPSTDILGNPRPSTYGYDIGCYEYEPAPPAAPVVTGETPASGATGVATNTAVTATFNEPVVASSITTGDFVLKNSGGTAVTATVSYNSSTDTATLTPSARLANSTTYTATISGVTDGSGHAMASAFSWSFTTGPAPALVSATPASGATGVAVSTTVTATFNEAVQASTISFALKNSAGTAVAATVGYDSATDTVTLTPGAALAYQTTYTATVSGALDTAGDPMSAPVTWSFTTDAAPPTVTKESPATGATGVAVSTTVTATFNEAVQASTINFALKNSAGTAVAATVGYDSATDTVTLTPGAALAYQTTYTATVSGALDTAGDPMSAPVSWSFTTDPLQPAVTGHTPATGATGVAVSTTVTATFNEAVQASTISFALKNSAGTAVAATVGYDSATDTVTLTPGAALAYQTTYTATVSGALDTAGDPMSAPVSWSFTTDPLQPAVTGHTPATGATGVAVSTTVTATFNEAVQASTISFALKNSAGTAVAATVGYDSATDTVTLTPGAALAYQTTYTATVSGALDTAGDPMSAPVTWSFTTDAAPPTVTKESPATGATGVAVSTTVTATFNEAVQASTISFALKNSAGTAVAATVGYDSATDTVTLTPGAALAYQTTYTATVSGALDTAGDPMSAPVSWSFTTDPLQPAVTGHTPATGATGVAVSTTVTATFNEAVQASTISFALKNSAGTAVAATVGYDSATDTVTLTPGAALAYQTTYTATVSGALDTAGDPMSAAGFLVVHHHHRRTRGGQRDPRVGRHRRGHQHRRDGHLQRAGRGLLDHHRRLRAQELQRHRGDGDGQLQQLDRHRHVDAVGAAGQLDDLHGDHQRRDRRVRLPHGQPGQLVVHHRAGPGGGQRDPRVGHLRDVHLLDRDGDVQRGGAGQHHQLRAQELGGQRGGGDGRLQQLDVHGHLDAHLEPDRRHDLYGDRQRRPGHGRRSDERPGFLVVHHRRRTPGPGGGQRDPRVGRHRRGDQHRRDGHLQRAGRGLLDHHRRLRARELQRRRGDGGGQLQQRDGHRHADAVGGAGQLDDLHGDHQRRDRRVRHPHGQPGQLVVHHRAGPGGGQRDPRVGHLRDVHLLDRDGDVQRGGAGQHHQLRAQELGGQRGGGDGRLQQLDVHGHLDAHLEPDRRHDLYGDRQRRPRHGRRSDERPGFLVVHHRRRRTRGGQRDPRVGGHRRGDQHRRDGHLQRAGRGLLDHHRRLRARELQRRRGDGGGQLQQRDGHRHADAGGAGQLDDLHGDDTRCRVPDRLQNGRPVDVVLYHGLANLGHAAPGPACGRHADPTDPEQAA